MDNNIQKSKHIQTIGSVAVLIVGGILIFVFAHGTQENGSTESVFSGLRFTTAEVGADRNVPVGWREYRNAAYRFSLLYPEGMTVREQEEGAGASSITFEDPRRIEGFQLFIVPYREDAISDERFAMDVPSGVRENVEKVYLDGVEGVAFDSTDQLFGPMKEVWFIHNGYLFEATTFKRNERQLSDILLTFKFHE